METLVCPLRGRGIANEPPNNPNLSGASGATLNPWPMTYWVSVCAGIVAVVVVGAVKHNNNKERELHQQEAEKMRQKREQQEAEEEAMRLAQREFEEERAATDTENKELVNQIVELVSSAGSQAVEMMRATKAIEGAPLK